MIRYAILGFLSWKPLTGYDLKQIFQNSTTMYWSGSNNQIYRTLVKLHDEQLVTRKIENQESGPSRKIYAITAAGKAALKTWLLGPPELPDIKNSFLIRVLWADRLNHEELDEMLASYQEEVNLRWIMQNEFIEREAYTKPDRTEREKLLRESVNKNWIMTFERELRWVQALRADLQKLATGKKKKDSQAKPYKFKI